MRRLSSAIWPIHYKPLPDELLSCWLVRLAHGHGLKAQTFCNAVFGNRLQVWNRDIDRLAPTWLLEELSSRTGASATSVLNTTLRFYEGKLYKQFRTAGILNWMLVLQMYHRKRNGHGLQFCPACLATDRCPYFRKSWRIAFYTVCASHGTMLLDRCPACSAAAAVHRVDMRSEKSSTFELLSICHICGFDLRSGPKVEPISFGNTKNPMLYLKYPEVRDTGIEWGLPDYSVMRQLCRIMTTRYDYVSLRQFVQEQLKFPDSLFSTGHTSFEMRTIEERHHLIQLAMWLLDDLGPRLTAAWRAGAVRYNLLLKDFPDPPDSYRQIVGNFSNWRDKKSTFPTLSLG